MLLSRRNVQARVGWVGVIWLVPVVGVLLYLLFGVNRIRRRAVVMHRRVSLPVMPPALPVHEEQLTQGQATICSMMNQVTRRPLLPGNHVRVFREGAGAAEAMLAAIAGARHTLTLCTYIFDNDALGRRFIAALADAARRGVEVRVLIDAVGSRYSWFNPVDRPLREAGVQVALFLPPRFLPWHLPYANLRNHRKILVADGCLGYTGGLNIREAYVLPHEAPGATLDLHFELRGPVVGQLQRSFQEDWLFARGEMLVGGAWFPPLPVVGRTLARGISDGPDEDMDKLRWALLAGIQGARRTLQVLTPYFLPEPEITWALNAAALRGVQVDIILPARSNLPVVDWASRAQLDELLEHGCRVWLTPAPFDHGKLFLVDGEWALIGSANWDPRSLRLNFEFMVECYDRQLGEALGQELARRRRHAHRLTAEALRGRSLPVRLRDGLAALFTPYL